MSSGFGAQLYHQLIPAESADLATAVPAMVRTRPSIIVLADIGALPGPAQEALTGRLVSKVVAPDELLPTARALAKEFMTKTAPVSVALIRQMMWRMLGADDPMEAHKVDSRGIYARGRSEDVKEGVVSFLEKRPAEFKNKVSTDMPDYFPWWTEREYK